LFRNSTAMAWAVLRPSRTLFTVVTRSAFYRET
jgi:hypothetical protein